MALLDPHLQDEDDEEESGDEEEEDSEFEDVVVGVEVEVVGSFQEDTATDEEGGYDE